MIYINEELCKGCYICIDICPRDVYTPSKKLNLKGVHVPIPDSTKCVKCQLCTLMCPDQVISIEAD
ncbi:ferredoxin family protein [Candidatus Methanosphaera massiliense]|jgi:2-oxoglutarate ferredoxin oxidoreductase subunit delta|uniref:4Fe-4S dicluster domain-containing protein n=1 Tax=Methanosphaera TaxID=2316 RepID=UPI00238046D9|nr:ferredoxin family protein [Candidatus Methanosphaera massiliense]MDD6286052.1 ferredoxin family protein [Methanobacteriaceae archaeon]MDE4077783.1 ferredoxin family protein [Candidatus Methanosphaera massiliense]MDY2744793.1 ferredoxin family protein [Methanosphaera sp.]